MTKRSTEREIEELADEVLTDLSPEERHRKFLQYLAEDDQEKADRVQETAPREDCSIREPEYVKPRMQSMMMAPRMNQLLQDSLSRYREARGEFKAAAQKADGEPDVPHPGIYLWQLFEIYDFVRQFADEEVGVEVEEFLVLAPDGRRKLHEVEVTLYEHRDLLEQSAMRYAAFKLERADGDEPAVFPDIEDIMERCDEDDDSRSGRSA